MIDVNVHLSRWPTRRLPADETPRLVEALRRHGVTQAWAGSFDALLHKDVAAVNQRLAAECQQFGDGLLRPFGTVNPTLPDWHDDLRRCRELHGMVGLRLYPNYHGYELTNPLFAELLNLAHEAKLLIQIALSLEDERTQHKLLRVSSVSPLPLLESLKTRPDQPVVLLNAMRYVRADDLSKLADAGRVYFDISTVEGAAGLATLIRVVPVERLLFGSQFPFYYFESAVDKLMEAELPELSRQAIRTGNAQSLLPTAS